MNEDSEDARIQAHLEADRPLAMSSDVVVYQRLFAALKAEPAIHPSVAFSLNVINQVTRQQVAGARSRFTWSLVGGIWLLFLLSFFGLFFGNQPTILPVLWSAFWSAKEWLFVGLTCLLSFLVLEHRFLGKQLIRKLHVD